MAIVPSWGLPIAVHQGTRQHSSFWVRSFPSILLSDPTHGYFRAGFRPDSNDGASVATGLRLFNSDREKR